MVGTSSSFRRLTGSQRHGAIRESRGDMVFLAFVHATLLLVLVIVLYPLVFILSSSFSSTAAVTGSRVRSDTPRSTIRARRVPAAIGDAWN